MQVLLQNCVHKSCKFTFFLPFEQDQSRVSKLPLYSQDFCQTCSSMNRGSLVDVLSGPLLKSASHEFQLVFEVIQVVDYKLMLQYHNYSSG
jgi:hypothetical protein